MTKIPEPTGYCPNCGNETYDSYCRSCGMNTVPTGAADKNVLLGKQFLFIRPEAHEKIQADISKITGRKEDDRSSLTIEKPTVISRYNKKITTARLGTQSPLSFQKAALCTAVTDRKVYRAKDPVRLFGFFPSLCSVEGEMEVKKNNLTLLKETLTVDSRGIIADTLENLEEGQYEVKLTAQGMTAECSFTVAEYSLSFLRASLTSREFDKDKKTYAFTLSVIRGDMPYSGKATIGLFCATRGAVVETLTLDSKDGEVSGTFTVGGSCCSRMILGQSLGAMCRCSVSGFSDASSREKRAPAFK